ncbi:MAG: type VI secretion system tip protein VgrG [Chitinispirillaceae bacterium]|nr:type VI secretion system tip protein VgrG [Chitinispirillaceae bacterium]
MADSPEMQSNGVVTFTIQVDGQPISDIYKVISILTCNRAGRIPYAQISIMDGKMEEGSFPVSDSDDFKPGKKIEITSGYQSVEESIFSGIIVKHGISILSDGFSALELECKSTAIKMTIGRKNANFLKKKDSEIITTLIQNAGLDADVGATTVTWEEMVQYYCTDWDFMLTRAEVSGLIPIVDNGKVIVKKPLASEGEVLLITYGIDIIDFSGSINATTQLKKIKGVAWDIKNQKAIEAEGVDPEWDAQGNLKRTDLSTVASPDVYRLQTVTPVEKTSITEWANAKFTKSNLAKITGHVTFCGSSKAKTGKVIKLAGVGARFEGKVFVTGTTHEIKDNNWTTTCEFGMSDEWFAQKNDVVAPPASGFLPGVEGLHIGKVMKLDGDPLQENRIQIKLPVLQTANDGVWARLAQFYGTNASGSFFIPEIDDEIIVGYFNNDPTQPVILGSLYSSKLKPPYEITKENFKKAIVSKEKLTIELDDEKKIITIKTPGENSIIIDDDAKAVIISDQNNNKISLSDSGILIDSGKDITLKAKGKITIDATDAVSIGSKADVAMKGNNVKITANIGATVKGSATAELSASGNTTVKGAMVMIN